MLIFYSCDYHGKLFDYHGKLFNPKRDCWFVICQDMQRKKLMFEGNNRIRGEDYCCMSSINKSFTFNEKMNDEKYISEMTHTL